MKKFNLIRVIGFLITISIGIESFAQYSDKSNALNKDLAYASVKKMSPGVEESDKEVLASLKVLNVKMHKDFTRHFTKATDIKMADTKHNTFISCKVDGIPTRIVYNEKGKWMHTVKYLNPASIPSEITEIVQDEYPKYRIMHANEVNVGNKTAFLVNIESNKFIKTVRVIDGQLDIYKEFSKQ